MRRVRFVSAALATALVLFAANVAQAQQKRVNFYNWSDYIDPAVLKDFTRETGIEVTYDTFDANEILETKLLAGKSGYDVVVPTAYFLERQIKAGVFHKLDKSKLPNFANVWPDIAKRLAAYDPGNQYAVNYMWGTTGIGYNVNKARDILGPDFKIDSWDLVFNADNLAKFKDCGVYMLDSSDDIFPAALNYLQTPGFARGTTKCCLRHAPYSAGTYFCNTSTRSRGEKSVWWSAGRATSSWHRSAPPRPEPASRSAIRSPRRGRRCSSTTWRSRRTPRIQTPPMP